METTERMELARAARSVLQEAGVPVGRKPTLTDAQIEEIHRLRKLGLSYTAIGKVVRTYRKTDGSMRPTSIAMVKRVLAGEYESREAYELRWYEEKRQALEAAEMAAM